eukprot:Gb_17524 [translate_table: standard]
MKLAEGRMEWIAEYVSFSPVSEDHICISGSGNISVWMYKQSFNKVSFDCRNYKTRPYEPHCHTWSKYGDAVYIGGLKGEVILISIKPVSSAEVTYEEDDKPSLHDLVEQDLKLAVLAEIQKGTICRRQSEWKVLMINPRMEKIVSICLGDNHIITIESGGRLQWIKVTDKIKEKTNVADSVSETISAKNQTFPENSRVGRSEDDEILTSIKPPEGSPGVTAELVAFVFSEMNVDAHTISTMQYRNDGTQILVGATSGCMLTIKVHTPLLQSLLLGSDKSAVDQGNVGSVAWKGEYHNGPIRGFASLGWVKLYLLT